MHLILNTNFNNAFKITLFGMPGGAFFMCSLPLTLEPGYATDDAILNTNHFLRGTTFCSIIIIISLPLNTFVKNWRLFSYLHFKNYF